MSEATLTAPVETRTDAPVDAAPETPVEEPVIETGDAYLESLSKGKESPESVPEPKLRAQPGLDRDPNIAQFVREHQSNHERRQHDTDGIADELMRDYGVPEAMARRIVKEQKDRLNEEHADGRRLSGYGAAATAVQYEQSHIQDAIAAALPRALLPKLSARMDEEIKSNGVASYQSVMQAIVELSREGFIDDKDHKAAIKQAFEDGRKQGLRGAATVDKSNGAAGRVQAVSVNSGKAPKTRAEAQALHAAGEIDNALYRDYLTKLAS